MRIAPILRRAVTALALALVASFAPASGAAATTTATWDGAGATVTWSTAANWGADAAPNGNVATLQLPATSPACLGWACSYTVDDIPGLTVGRLQIDSSADYLVTPMSSADSLELTDGLSFGTSSPAPGGRLLTTMIVPLTLGAAQTWNLSGAPGTPTQLTLGAVTGEAYPLTLDLASGLVLDASELDTGPLTINGAGLVSLAAQTATPADSIPLSPPPPLAGTQGIDMRNGASLMFTSPGAVSGAIAVAPGSYSTLEVGHGVAPDGTVVVNGNVTLRATSTLEQWIDQPATVAQAARRRRGGLPKPQPSTDYSQITVLGSVALNGADLSLSQGYTGTQVTCAAMTGGQTYTLLAATQLIGTFSGIANGQVIALGACNPAATGPTYSVIIRYNTRARPETVTATVVGPAQIKSEVTRALSVPAAAADVGTVLPAGGYNTTFDAPTTGTLSLTWRARAHGQLVTIASGSNVAGQVGPRRVPLELTPAGRALLRRSRRSRRSRPLTVTATADFTPIGQSTVMVSRPLTLR